MTRQRMYAENTNFSQWVRSRHEIDSIRHGLTVNDYDFIFHRYKSNVDGVGVRWVHLAMCVEVKSFYGLPHQSQLETLFFHHQLLRKKVKLLSPFNGEKKMVWHFGYYVLSMPGTYPGEGDDIVRWYQFDDNGTLIPRELTVEILIKVLGLDWDPSSLNPVDLRRHHRSDSLLRRTVTALGFPTDETIRIQS